MGRRRARKKTEQKPRLRQQIARHVASAFPGCTAEFVGQQSRASLAARTFGFRVKDSSGKYRSNIVWVDSEYRGAVSEAWVRHAVELSNG